MGLNRIATAEIDRADAMKRFMSFERLRATRGDANGPLQRIIAWFKSEDALNFSTSHMRLGRANDDYVVLYYFEGMRWKIAKDGHAFVSAADADNMCKREERDLQLLIDTILNDEIARAMAAAFKRSGNIRCGRAKHVAEDQGYYTKTLLGIQD